MFSEFKEVPVESDPRYKVVQPPSGLLKLIKEKHDLYRTEGVEDTLSMNVWATVFLFSAIYFEDKPLVVVAAQKYLPSDTPNTSSIREVFQKMDNETFKTLVEEFLFDINRDKLTELFEALDKSCLVTKRATDETKND